jgi:hypothetical protein
MAHVTQTTTPLGAATTFTGDTLMRGTFDTVKGIVFSDTAGTLHIEQGFMDPAGVIHWDYDVTVAVSASTGAAISTELLAPHWRVRFVQAGTQTVFRLFAAAAAAGTIGG